MDGPLNHHVEETHAGCIELKNRPQNGHHAGHPDYELAIALQNFIQLSPMLQGRTRPRI
jgi:hypothetical protein